MLVVKKTRQARYQGPQLPVFYGNFVARHRGMNAARPFSANYMEHVMSTKHPCASPAERKFTWGELKKLIEASGVKAEDEIDKIEISWGDIEEFTCTKDEDFGWQIRL